MTGEFPQPDPFPSELVEAAAREWWDGASNGRLGSWSAQEPRVRRDYLRRARAVLAVVTPLIEQQGMLAREILTAFEAEGGEIVEVHDATHRACSGTGRLTEPWPQADGSGKVGDRCHCVHEEVRWPGQRVIERPARDLTKAWNRGAACGVAAERARGKLTARKIMHHLERAEVMLMNGDPDYAEREVASAHAALLAALAPERTTGEDDARLRAAFDEVCDELDREGT